MVHSEHLSQSVQVLRQSPGQHQVVDGDAARSQTAAHIAQERLAERLRHEFGADVEVNRDIIEALLTAAHEFERKLAFEDLATGGSFIVFDHSRDVLEIARNFTHFFAHESCGFCTPCRVGTSLLRNTLDKICAGHGTPYDLVELTHLAKLVRSTSHCGLGQTAANPILSTLERFPNLYEARLKDISFEPGFDLDGALATARRLAGRDDAHAHLEQVTD